MQMILQEPYSDFQLVLLYEKFNILANIFSMPFKTNPIGIAINGWIASPKINMATGVKFSDLFVKLYGPN